ncbi:MAG: ATP-dependent Clp protease adapter ClpS, partial [Gammaproteobacteria bacterium]|nr:ATP-dependent Clp protease adapter ClpS [Gammaproteobacteria bacterium]
AATKIMLAVHHEGYGVCGLYSRDVADTKVAQVNDFSRANEHPLLCTLEAE